MRSILSSLLSSKVKQVSFITGAVVALYAIYKLVEVMRQAQPPIALPPDEHKVRDNQGVHQERELEKDAEDDLESYLRCPISGELMEDPVVTSNGQTYDRKNIKQWFDLGHHSDPMTNGRLVDRTLKPNYAIKSLIDAYQKKQVSLNPPCEQKIIPSHIVQVQRNIPPEAELTQRSTTAVETKMSSHNRIAEQKPSRDMNETELKTLFETRFAQLSASSNLISEQKIIPSYIVRAQRIMLSEAEAAQRSNATTEILSKLSSYANAEGFFETFRKHYQLQAWTLLKELQSTLLVLPINTTQKERAIRLRKIMTNILKYDQNKSGSFDEGLRFAWNKLIDCYPEIAELYPKLPEKRNDSAMLEDFFARGGHPENIEVIENNSRVKNIR